MNDFEDDEFLDKPQGRGRGARKRVSEKPRERIVKNKFLDKKNIPELIPMNPKQKRYIELINDYNIVFATGYAGTSKTYIPTAIACKKLIEGEINQIILTRPNISNSKSIGMFKGTLVEKMTPWLGPVLSVMRKYFEHDTLEQHISKGNIEFVPMEVIKGYSFSDCFILCDEAEDLSADDAKKLVTRQGDNSKLILAGDVTQSELKSASGFAKLMDMAQRYPSIGVGCIDFNEVSEIVRSREAREWIKAFIKEEKNDK